MIISIVLDRVWDLDADWTRKRQLPEASFMRELVQRLVGEVKHTYMPHPGAAPMESVEEGVSADQAADDEDARYQRAEQAARLLLLEMDLHAGDTEVKITTLLVLRYQDVTHDQVRRALEAFDISYEQRAQRAEAGGTTPWPTADAVIASLFGPR